MYGTGVLAVTATPGTPSPGLRGSTATELVLDGDCVAPSTAGTSFVHCDCDYHPGGCRISSIESIPGCACKCVYETLLWTCHGQDANCKDPNSDACKNPDDTKASCEQGGGDCGGYKD